MKKLITGILLAGLMISTVAVRAECTTEIFYSEKEWVEHHDFFDVPFTSDQNMMINSYQIAATVNALGTFAFPRRTDSSVQSGKKELVVQGNENTDDYPFFEIVFGKPIRIKEAVIDCSAVDNTGKTLDKSVWINARMDWDGNKAVIKEGEKVMTTSQQRMTIPLQEKEVSNLIVLFDNFTEFSEYHLGYFQIPSYRSYDHVRWTDTPIENTETKEVQVCLDNGKFEPDGTAGVWKKESSGVFTPSTSVLGSMVPEIESQHGFYDYGRGGHIPAYSDPDVVKGLDAYSSRISGWTDEKEGKYHHFWSYGPRGKQWPYIETGPGNGVRYQADPVYWTQQKGLPDYLWQSEDASWCQHTTGSRKTPCYKYRGHHTNSRYNSYDVRLYSYRNLYDPNDHTVSKARYVLINADSQERRVLKEDEAKPYLFSLHESGRWILSAELQDESGNTGTAESRLFLIDNQVPQLTYQTGSEGNWENQPVPVTITGQDSHSGVKAMRWALSVDGGLHFTDYSSWVNTDRIEMTLHDSGILQLKTEIEDNAGNRNIVYSPLIRIDPVAPVIERVVIEDETTGKTVSDTRNGQWQWINAASRLKIKADPVYDLPEEINSGIDTVTSTVQQQSTELILKEGVYTGYPENRVEGKHQMEVVAVDKAGNRSLIRKLNWAADYTGPEIRWKTDPETWTNQDVKVTLTATDSLSGVVGMEASTQKSESESMILTAHDNGRYKVTATDKAGNRTEETVVITNIDRIPPVAAFDPFTKETEEKELTVHVQPSDGESGIDRWRYKITYDDGQSFISTSPWFTDGQVKEVKLTLAGNCRIVCELQDKAGNHAEVMSGEYHLSEGDASAASLMIPSVVSTEEGYGLFRAVCKDCNPEKRQTVTVMQQSEIIYQQQLQALPEQTVRFPFRISQPDTLFVATVEYEQDQDRDNNSLSVLASPASEQFIRSSEEEIAFTGIVMYTADRSGKRNYSEQLTLKHIPDQEGIFAGQPVDSVITTHYHNECDHVENWGCVGETLPATGSATAFYDQGALPVREHYLDHGRYKVPMIQEGFSLHIPVMWVSQFSGQVNDEKHFDRLEENEKILDGGTRWYTDPESEKKTVNYEFTGKDFGVNHFSFCLDRTARIRQTMKESYRKRFVNPEDAATVHSRLWDPYLDWFRGLKGKTPLKVK